MKLPVQAPLDDFEMTPAGADGVGHASSPEVHAQGPWRRSGWLLLLGLLAWAWLLLNLD
ncbi:hypothetical protein PSQ39_07245 [Curvibacter sp. HBC28]|uniref:Uncharacterized protein n=1 Tax=Curvibacter microcysteis TaxID=3026419 RepID=A0ABT5MCW5_9BURK|nr:hypothetical protein [Curvibacter sp. HBC28]MDD0814421.1 hypothetical protein [Curvibacter sp. HBC28]